MKDLDYFILEELTKDEFEEITKKILWGRWCNT